MRGSPVLVTGGAGFIGSHVVDALLAAGAEVAVLDNFASGRRRNLAASRDHIELIEDDIRDLDVCRRACRGRRLVFHLAALGSVTRSMNDPALSISTNLLGSTHVFVAAREAGVERTVFASSSNVYGDHTALPMREGREGEPLSPYAASKQMVEKAAAVFHRSFGQKLVGLRYFNVYGPRQTPDGEYAAVIPKFFRALLAGEAPIIYGNGEQSRDFTAVPDAVRATLLAASAPDAAQGLAFNIAGGRRTTVNELAALALRLTGGELAPRHVEPRPGDIRHSHADLGRSAELLGYRPRLTLEQGLQLALDHYREVFSTRAAGPTDGRGAESAPR